MTANESNLKPMNQLIKHECGIDLQADRYKYVGMEDIPGFEAIHNAQKVDIQKLQPGIVERAIAATRMYPKARCFIMECTQSSCFSNAVRKATGLPVFDCITNCDYLMSAHMSNPRFGLQDW